MTHPLADPSPSLTLAGRGERIAPRALLVCDRCLGETTMLVPWAKGLDTGLIYKCCLHCESEMLGQVLP